MIELNPFTKFTSACLFNWKHDSDILKVCDRRGKEGGRGVSEEEDLCVIELNVFTGKEEVYI